MSRVLEKKQELRLKHEPNNMRLHLRKMFKVKEIKFILKEPTVLSNNDPYLGLLNPSTVAVLSNERSIEIVCGAILPKVYGLNEDDFKIF